MVDVEPAAMVTEAGTVASLVSSLASVTTKAVSSALLIETVPVAVPPFSLIDVLSRETDNTAVSSSVTTTFSDAFPNALDPVIETVLSPSSIASSTPVTVKFAEVVPARIVTEAGTVASLVSSLAKLTTRSDSRAWLKVTVPVAEPPFSFMEVAESDKERMAVSSSMTTTSVDAFPTELEPLIVTVLSPSSRLSSTPATVKLAVEAPAKIVTDAGTLASLVSLLTSETTVSVAMGVVRETVPTTEPPFSLRFVGEVLIDTVVVSMSVTLIAEEAEPTPVPVTVMFADCVPSTRLSVAPEMEKVPEVAPAKMTIDVGTVASLVSLLDNETVRSVNNADKRFTVPVAVPFSAIEAGLIDKTIPAASSSNTSMFAASLPFELVAEIVVS